MEINTEALKMILGAAFLIAWFYGIKAIMKTQKAKKLGITGMNLLLFANLKNIVNAMPDDKRKIYETLFHNIIIAEDNQEELAAMTDAYEQLEDLEE